MGTRALIYRNNKRWLYTHWDGYPESLGKRLKKINNLPITEQKHILHSFHTIDFIFGEGGGWVMSNPKSFKNIRTKPGRHNDFADYAYHIKRGKVYYREVNKFTGEIVDSTILAKMREL